MKTWLLRFCFFLIFTLIFPIQTHATTRRSPEESRVMNLAVFIEIFAKAHNGRLPASMNELSASAPLNLLGIPPIRDRYTIAANAPVSHELDGAQILAVGRISFSDEVLDGIGRFVIFRTKDGQYQTGWYPEDKIQKIIAETHLVVPPQSVPQPTILPHLTHGPMTKEQYELLKRNGLLPPREEISIISDSSGINATNPPEADISMPATQRTPALTLASAEAQTLPAKDNGIPWWIYGIIVVSLGLLGGLWYFLRPKN